MKRIAVIACITVCMVTIVFAARPGPVIPSARDKCPVCGMFVKKYPVWTGQIVFRDGTYAVFDGAKDLFKYFLGLKKYNPSRTKADIDAVYVMDYYRVELIDAYSSYYVAGSDVYGPMGRELIPFAKADDAHEFMKDHHGKAILRFSDVTPELLKSLD